MRGEGRERKGAMKTIVHRTSRVFLVVVVLLLSLVGFAQTPGAPAEQAGATPGSVRLPTAETPPETGATTEAAAEGAKKEEAKGEATTPGEEKVYLNVQEQEIKDVIRQISKATGKNFIIDDKVRGKVTIMSEKMMTKEEAYQAFLSALEVAGFTIASGPGGIIKVVSLKEAVSAPIPIHVDSTPYTDSYITRLISLKNISALEMSNVIKGLISTSGNLFAYPATNTLIITDSGTNIDRLMKIIKELDQEGPQQILEIIPINYADAKDVAQKVLQLFEIAAASKTTRQTRGAAPQLEELEDVSKIIADQRTNSIIVLASKRAIDKVRDVIAKLDAPLKAKETGMIHVHYLKYAKATDLATTLSSITSGTKTKSTTTGSTTGTTTGKASPVVAQLEGGISIGADEGTNALIITASPKDYQTLVDELISKLDIPSRQVYLESIVMELEVEKADKAGFSGFGGGGNNTLLGFGNTGSSSFNVLSDMFSPTTGGGFFAAPGLLGGILSRDTITVNVPKSGGGTTAITIPAFAAFLNILQTYRDANIVSSPNILTVDNQKASIEVTKKRYIPTTTITATAGATTAGSTPVEAGLTLEITPQITEGDAVRMEIHQKLSNFTGEATGTLGPPETKREFKTTVVVMDGQTIVLGGLMEDAVTHTKSKVPILGDIPLLGLLFRSSSGRKMKSNLLVFITPHVIKDPSDFAEISKTKIEQRNRFIESNYGKRQRQSIRDTIAMHRADLLEFVPSTTSYTPSPTTLPLPQSTSPSPSPKTQPTAPVTPKSPVITAPPVGTQGAALESSAAKPVSAPPTAVAPKKSKVKKEEGEVDTAY